MNKLILSRAAWFIVDKTGRTPRLMEWTGSSSRRGAWDAHLHHCAGWSEAQFAGHTEAKERIRLRRQRGDLVAVKATVTFEAR